MVDCFRGGLLVVSFEQDTENLDTELGDSVVSDVDSVRKCDLLTMEMVTD